MNGLVFLILSSCCEGLWNVFLTKSKGLGDWSNNALGVFFLILGIITFKKALDDYSLSVASVIWSGLSLLLTIALDVYLFKTKIDYRVALFMTLTILSIIGLNYYSSQK